MMHINSNLYSLFKERIHLLIIDDDPVVIDILTSLFSSSLFNISSGSSVEEAFRIIDTANHPWHCWILDIAMTEARDGLKILKKYRTFPFTIMLSGLGSMNAASEAIENGAMKVFDKDPDSLGILYDTVCRIASLGFILNGKGGQYLSFFVSLMNNCIENLNDWAASTFKTARHIDRICEKHTNITPRYIISLYYTLYYILLNDASFFSESQNSHDSISTPNKKSFLPSHVKFFERNYKKYEKWLMKRPRFDQK